MNVHYYSDLCHNFTRWSVYLWMYFDITTDWQHAHFGIEMRQIVYAEMCRESRVIFCSNTYLFKFAPQCCKSVVLRNIFTHEINCVQFLMKRRATGLQYVQSGTGRLAYKLIHICSLTICLCYGWMYNYVQRNLYSVVLFCMVCVLKDIIDAYMLCLTFNTAFRYQDILHLVLIQ